MLQKVLDKYGITEEQAKEIYEAVDYDYKKQDVISCLEDYFIDAGWGVDYQELASIISFVNVDAIVDEYIDSIEDNNEWRGYCMVAVINHVNLDSLKEEVFGEEEECD